MAYCLVNHRHWPNNIICKEVTDYVKQERQNNRYKNSYPLHKDLHHGLSSQAMVFNLFGPLIVRNDFATLRRIIEKLGIRWPTGNIKAAFEYDDRSVFNEDSGQPTSIDISLIGDSGSIFIEAKLSEKEFGGCSVYSGGDCEGSNPYPDNLGQCYLHHIGRKYWQRMDEFGFADSAIMTGVICPFINYYQFFREVMFAFDKDGTFILLHDERNPAFLKQSSDSMLTSGLWPFLYDSIPQRLRHRVLRLTIQDIVKTIEESGGHEKWLRDFKEKYGLIKIIPQ